MVSRLSITGVRHSHTTWWVALVLLMLAITPVTAPFASIDFAELAGAQSPHDGPVQFAGVQPVTVSGTSVAALFAPCENRRIRDARAQLSPALRVAQTTVLRI